MATANININVGEGNGEPIFRYRSADGIFLTPEDISNYVDVITELVHGVYNLCELHIKNPQELVFEEHARLRLIQAGMGEAMNTLNKLSYWPDENEEGAA